MSRPLPPVIERVAKWATDTPDRPAITDRDGTMTYGHLWSAIDRWAVSLTRHGVRAGDAVGILLPNRGQCVAALLGIVRVNAVAVLVPPSLPSGVRRYGEMAGTRLILAEVAHQSRLRHEGAHPCPEAFGTLHGFTLSVPHVAPLVQDDLIVQLTSGTDQPSKLAVRTADAVLDEIVSFTEAVQLSERDTTLVLSAISHSYGLIGGTLAPLSCGGHVILQEFLDPDWTRLVIQLDRPTLLFGIPSVYRLLAQTPSHGEEKRSAPRLCLSAGAPLPQTVDDTFARRFGRRICQDYGSTEAGVITLRLTWAPHLRNSVGRPLRGREVAIIGRQDQRLTPGHVGEIVVNSPALARGYLDDSTHLVPIDPHRYHTGDLGWMDEAGHLFLTGRTSSLIQLADAVIDPTVIEAVIARVPGVVDVAVVGTVDSAGHQQVKAAVVGEDVHTDDVLRCCRQYLPVSHVPQVVEFRDAIPRTAAGKMLRRLLR